MSTLSNVTTRRGESNPPSIRFTPDAFPEAKSSQTGVSVRYVPDGNKHWYVFRASYGREDRALDYIVEDGTYAYIAKRYVRRVVNGKLKKIQENLVPNLLFIYAGKEKAEEYIKSTPALSYLTYYYNHFEQIDNQKNPPLTVPSREMENFILATSNQSEHLRFVVESQCHYKVGGTVWVVNGPFKGVAGRVARVAGQQRVVISLTGIGLISTAYIPTAFLSPKPPEGEVGPSEIPLY